MQEYNDINTMVRFGPRSLWVGILLIIAGICGVALPAVMSAVTVAFVAGLILIAGAIWGWHSMQHATGWSDWLKPILLLVVGGLMIYQPWTGIASIALLIVAYLALDAIASFSLARGGNGKHNHSWMILNGVVDILLVILFLWGWPESSLWMVGMFIGISLVFDGWALVMIGWSLRQSGLTTNQL
jgi:uncharacterized membrane protein HdeD (DUF308 family)